MQTTTRTSYLDSLPTNKVDLSSPTKVGKYQSPWYQPFSDYLGYLYMQFLLVTTLYVMEPWERFLMMTIFFLVLSLVSYSALVYIPFHLHHILKSTVPSLTNVLMQ